MEPEKRLNNALEEMQELLFLVFSVYATILNRNDTINNQIVNPMAPILLLHFGGGWESIYSTGLLLC